MKDELEFGKDQVAAIQEHRSGCGDYSLQESAPFDTNPTRPQQTKVAVMSNARIIERLNRLADALESGEITIREFAEQLPGHTSAVDNLDYCHIKESQRAALELEQMADYWDEGMNVDPLAGVVWLRQWLTKVPP